MLGPAANGYWGKRGPESGQAMSRFFCEQPVDKFCGIGRGAERRNCDKNSAHGGFLPLSPYGLAMESESL
jgi:hypothetical protein